MMKNELFENWLNSLDIPLMAWQKAALRFICTQPHGELYISMPRNYGRFIVLKLAEQYKRMIEGEKEMSCKENAEKTCKSYPNCRGCGANTDSKNMTSPCGDGTARAYADNHNQLSMVRLGPNTDVWRVTGKIIDRLHEYEKLGYEPEQLERIIKLWRVYRQMAHSQYGTMATKRNVPVDMKNMFDTIDSVNEFLVKKIMEQPAITQPVNYQKVWVTTSSSIKDDELTKKLKEVAEEIKKGFEDGLRDVKDIDEMHTVPADEGWRLVTMKVADLNRPNKNGSVLTNKETISKIQDDLFTLTGVPKTILDSPVSNRTRDIYNYILYDTKVTKEMRRVLQNKKENAMTVTKNPEYQFKIKRVLFNNPATIVFWADGDKTVVKCQNGEPYDPEKGLAMAISKKALGNGNKWYNEFKKQLENCDAGFHMHSAAWCGYNRLVNALHDKKATKADLVIAMEEAIGYFGEEIQ